MRRATEIEVTSVSIPAISTGAFAVPFAWAIPIAVGAVFDFLDVEDTSLKIVRHVVYTREVESVEQMFKAEINSQIQLRNSDADSITK